MWPREGGVAGEAGAINERSVQVLATLEPAAAVILSPNLVSPERLKEAEAIFLDFRKINRPYQLCKEILEGSQNEYVLFETVGLLKISIVKEWASIKAEDVQVLKNYLIQYVAHKPLPTSVREKILQVLSIIVKWQSLEDGGTSRHELVQNAKSLISNGGEQSALGCSLLSAILQEHTSNARPSDNLSPDKRHQIRRQFECTDLFDISSFGIQTLQNIVEKGALNNRGDIIFSEKLLQLVRTALCWGQSTLMLPALLFDSDRKEQSEAWTKLITDDKFFITLGVLGRQGEPLLSPVLSCLEQLTYAIAGCSEMDKENALRLARALFPLLGVAPSPAPATALRRLVVNYSRHLLSLPPDEFLQFLTTLLAYIEHLIRLSALEEANTANGIDEEGGWQMGLEAALEAWVELLHVCAPQLSTIRPPKPIPPPFIEGSAHIFDALLKTRLAPPDGTRYAGVENEAEIEEEGSDIERYDSLLSLAGALGQAAPEHSIPLLCRLLESRTIRMQELFMTGLESPELCCIYEDLHWTILFAAHILTQDGEGEIPAIPGKLVHHSIRVPGDLEASVRLLSSPESHPSNEDLQIANHTIRLVAGVWRMCWIAGWGVGRWAASPTLGASVTWFLRRWARAYWLPGDSCAVVSGKPGPVLRAVWGQNSPRDIWAAQRLSSGALALLRSLPGDPAPTHHAIALLRSVALINCQEGSSGMVHVWEAVKWGIGTDGVGLSEEARRGLAAAASAAVSAFPEDQQLPLLNDLLAPINSKLMMASCSSAYLQALDIYTGLAEGCQPKSANSIWKILEPAIAASVQGLRYGSAVTRNTLHLAAACVGYLSQSTLNLSGGRLLSHIIDMLRAYSSQQVLQFNNANHAADAEDDYCEETMLVIEIVSELVAKGYNDTTESGSKCGMAAVLEGIRVILPRMMPPTPLLQRPNVAKRYYRLLFDFGPDIICPLEDQFFNAIMRSIADGLEAPSDEDAMLMCKLLGNLGRRANSTISGSSRLLDTLPSLANRLLSSAATGALQAHIEFAASTYYILACSLKNIQLPPELASLMKSNIPTMQLKTAFTKYFSHLQTLHSI